MKQLSGLFASIGTRFFGQVVLCGSIACVPTFAQQTAPPTTPPPAATHPVHSTELPPGEGRDTVMKVCSKCHSPSILAANPRNRQGWEDTITKMSGLGAMATDDEFTTILEYLAKNVNPDVTSKVNVNKATSAELQSGLDLPAKDAEAVVAYRSKNGDFKSVDDVKKVPDVDTKKLDDKKDKLSF